MLEGGCNVTRLTRSTPGGFRITRGGRGGGGCSGEAMLRRIFELSEPAWETGDDRAKLGRSQCVAISSPLDISLVVMQKPTVAVVWLEG